MLEFEATLISPVRALALRAGDSVEQVKVDGREWFFTRIRPNLHTAYSELLLPSGIGTGRHTLHFVVHNLHSEDYFDIKEAHGLNWLKVVLLTLWGAAVFALSNRFTWGTAAAWPIVVAGLLAFQYVEVITPWLRQHDVGGHREYIDYLGTHFRLPPVQQGWETWQPPLYYLAAVFWRFSFPLGTFDDPFRPVQFLAALLYVATIGCGMWILRRLHLKRWEAVWATAFLALLPGNLFFAARINNDILLPLFGAGVLFATAEFVKSGEFRWLWWIAFLLPAGLATKGSSLAITAGSLFTVLWYDWRRSGWWPALRRTYLTGLPAGLWEAFWWLRTAAETGNPLYVNAALPDNLRVLAPIWHRLLSFDLPAFVNGGFYYDPPMWNSYPTALVTSLLCDEYNMSNYGLKESFLLRWGCLGMLLVVLVGMSVAPRAELRPVWLTSLILLVCHTAITVAYAVQFPFACNQNMRFFAQVFVPFACLFGLGAGHFCQRGGWAGRGALGIQALAALLGLGEFYLRVLF